jgi:hypothetical protein
MKRDFSLHLRLIYNVLWVQHLFTTLRHVMPMAARVALACDPKALQMAARAALYCGPKAF